jgi:hypothetical protein
LTVVRLIVLHCNSNSTRKRRINTPFNTQKLDLSVSLITSESVTGDDTSKHLHKQQFIINKSTRNYQKMLANKCVRIAYLIMQLNTVFKKMKCISTYLSKIVFNIILLVTCQRSSECRHLKKMSNFVFASLFISYLQKMLLVWIF